MGNDLHLDQIASHRLLYAGPHLIDCRSTTLLTGRGDAMGHDRIERDPVKARTETHEAHQIEHDERDGNDHGG